MKKLELKSKNAKLNKYNEFVVNDHSLSIKIPLNYSRSTPKIEYISIGYCHNSCEMFKVINVKALLENENILLTVKYEGMSI